MKFKGYFLIVGVIFVVGMLCTQIASAYTYVDYNVAIIKTADRLVALQGPDGGWDWIIPDTATSYVGPPPSPENLYGVTALAILEAYKTSPKPGYMTAMVNVYTGASPRPEVDSGPDMPFFVELSKITGNSMYANLAKARYDAKIAAMGGTATAFATSLRALELGAGWDYVWALEPWVRAALALDSYFPGLGYDTDALDMVQVIYSDWPGYFDWSNFQTICPNGEYILALSGAVQSFSLTGTHLAEATSLKNALLSYQQPDGSWWSLEYPTGTLEAYQDTAYAVMALMAYGGTPQVSAARKGAEWLISEQNPNGGWSGSDECPEVDSEAAQALAASNPGPPVGGVWVPINKFELLAPWIGLASLITVVMASVGYVKRRKKKQT